MKQSFSRFVTKNHIQSILLLWCTLSQQQCLTQPHLFLVPSILCTIRDFDNLNFSSYKFQHTSSSIKFSVILLCTRATLSVICYMVQSGNYMFIVLNLLMYIVFNCFGSRHNCLFQTIQKLSQVTKVVKAIAGLSLMGGQSRHSSPGISKNGRWPLSNLSLLGNSTDIIIPLIQKGILKR